MKSAGRTLTTQEIKHLHIKNVQKSSGNIDTLEYQVAIWQTSGSMKYFKIYLANKSFRFQCLMHTEKFVMVTEEIKCGKT